MRWLAAIDLLPESAGVLELVAWLARTGRDATKDDFVALTLAREADYFTAPDDLVEHIGEGISRALRRQLDASPARDHIGRAEGAVVKSIADALVQRAAEMKATLMVGRRAGTHEQRLVRLGQTVRRVLRKLEGPIIVVPPDLRADSMTRGPIVVAVDASPESLAAAAYARRLGAWLERDVHIAHVIPSLAEVGLEHLSPTRSQELRQEHRVRAEEAFAAFCSDHRLGDLPRHAMPGPVVDAVLDLAQLHDACMIVVGSRRLSLVDRILTASVGTELTAVATVPVAIVPPEHTAA